MSSLLEYDARAVATGELWRILTCHFVHWTPEHFAWDFGAFVLLLLVAWRAGIPARQVALVTALAAVAIPLALDLARYRGLSGIDSVLFVLVAMQVARDRRAIGIAALVGCFAKIGFELASGAALFVPHLGAGVVPVPMAHLVGGVVGLLLGRPHHRNFEHRGAYHETCVRLHLPSF